VATERVRLARELHDSVTQTLFAANIIAGVLPAIWQRNPTAGQRRLEELRGLTQGALAEIRMLLLELRPAQLVETPLGDHRTIVGIGGPDVTAYRHMIETVAAERGRHPLIVGVPLLTPSLSSYWCDLTTSVPAALARPIIEGMTTPMVVQDDEATRRFPAIQPMPFREALRRAFAAS